MMRPQNKQFAWRMFLIVLLAMGSFGTAVAQNSGNGLRHSMKGYEIYSWQTRGQWYFSLVVGTNRQKTFQEISSLGSRLKGVSALKKRLDQLPAGEELFWSTRRMPKTILPPKATIDAMIAYCRDRHLNLRVGQMI